MAVCQVPFCASKKNEEKRVLKTRTHMLYRERNQYLPVMMMLRLAIQQGEAYHNEHISMIVHDAQQLYLKNTTIHQINRSVYSYTVAIERYNPTLVSRMNPSHLMREDYISLLKFFETL